MKIRFLGAARSVTGSCFHLEINGRQMLVDCGMRQGEDAHQGNAGFLFNPADIEVLFLTHAHIDHSGMIPKLVKDGFRGRIITTRATADLAQIMLLDSAHIHEREAEWRTKKSLRQGKDTVYEPIYTVDDAKAAMPFFEGAEYHAMGHVEAGVGYRFWDAGHILGSGSFEMWYQDSPVQKRIVFSGDVGKGHSPIIRDPEHAKNTDYIVVESTYGNRLHKGFDESINELVEAIKVTFKKGGNVIMPAFAVGRTQDLLYIFDSLVRQGRLHPLDVYVDSPMAREATSVYLKHREDFGESAKKLSVLKGSDAIHLHFTASVEESQAINKLKSGVVIMAGSGMCEGGRIAHHLKHNLWRPECSIIFTGFQARGTLGRRIVDGAQRVHVLGEEIAVRAKVYTIGGFSAHADQAGLLAWLGSFTGSPEVFIVHGEESVALEFEALVKEKLSFATHVPHKGDEYNI